MLETQRDAEIKRLKEALRLARADLLRAVEEIDRELSYKPAVSNGELL